jgi:predicted transcriptional regulator
MIGRNGDMLNMAATHLRTIRESLKLSQEQLARQAGVPLRTYVRAESGGKVKYSTAKPILDAINAALQKEGQTQITLEDLGLSLS